MWRTRGYKWGIVGRKFATRRRAAAAAATISGGGGPRPIYKVASKTASFRLRSGFRAFWPAGTQIYDTTVLTVSSGLIRVQFRSATAQHINYYRIATVTVKANKG